MAEKVSYLLKVEELVEFLTNTVVRPNELARFLSLRTLDFLNPKSIYFAKIEDNGTLSPVDCYGYTKEQIEPYSNLELNLQIPLCQAIRNNEILIIPSIETWNERYPDYLNAPLRHGWQAMITLPIQINSSPIGSISLTFNEPIEICEEFEQFAKAISSIISLQLTRVPHGRLGSLDLAPPGGQVPDFLSKRQIQILRHIAENLTNAQIAKILGYSESTIRHETMKIYELLQVRGRKEAVSFALSRRIIERVSLLLPLLILELCHELELAIPQLSLIGI